MKTISLIATATLALSLPAAAALPPFADSAVQMKVVMESEQVADAVNWGFAEAVEYVGQADAGASEWRVVTAGCSVLVEIRALSMPEQDGAPMVGAVNYEVSKVTPCPEVSE